MENKKGLLLLGSYTVKLIMGILVFILIAYAIYRLYSLYQGASTLTKLEKQMKTISSRIESVSSTGISESEILFPADKDWVLKGFEIDFPGGECAFKESCICVCNILDCSGLKSCEGFDYNVLVGSDSTVLLNSNSIKIIFSQQNNIVRIDKG